MSGPAAGAMAAARIGLEAGLPNLITCDMGGTSFDVTVIGDGEPAVSAKRTSTTAMPIRMPMIDIHTIGAGGGTLARITTGGILQVGPHSAGADAGPDLLRPRRHRADRHRRQPRARQAQSRRPSRRRARRVVEHVRAAIDEKIGRPLGLDAIQARGRDPHRRQRHLAERHPPRVDRERLRSARLRDLRRSAARGRCMPASGARARRAEDAGTALSRPHVGVGLRPGRRPARFRRHGQPAVEVG